MGSSSSKSSSKKSNSSSLGGTTLGTVARAASSIYDSINRVPSTTQAVKTATNVGYNKYEPATQTYQNSLTRDPSLEGMIVPADYMERGGGGSRNDQPVIQYDELGNLQYQPIDNTALYNQQAAEKAAQIRQAIARQRTAAEGNISNLQTQYGTAVKTAQDYGAQLPGQFTQLNNQASNRGQVNAQRIRTAMAQMGLGQSGASASQQLEQNLATDNQINANNQQLQNLTTNINTQVSGLQGEQASKVAAIRQAIADAEAAGDENSALALSEAQAKIVAEANANAVGRNNWNLSMADKIRQAKESAETNAWSRAGFNSAYEQFQAEEALRQANELESERIRQENRLAEIREQAKYRTSGSSGGLTAGQEESSRKAMNDWVTKQVAADERLLPDMSNYAVLYDAWKTMYTKMNYGG